MTTSSTLPTDVASSHEALRTRLEQVGRLVVAFSGGADSALLSYVATDVLGRDAVLCATAISASLPDDERTDCQALADEWNLRHLFVETNELAVPAYIKNDVNRCYFCKDELMNVLGEVAQKEGATIALGVNLDDLGDFRPGQRAARHKGAVFPLVDAGFSKGMVRTLSRFLGLRTADKPAAACLSSRVPHGTPVTFEILDRVGRAEAGLRRLGFAAVRVRHYGDTARLELEPADFDRCVTQRDAVVEIVIAAGYRYVTLDLQGLRSGNLAQEELRRLRQSPDSVGNL